MKKIIKLTESDLTKLVKKIIKEQRIDDSIPYEKEYQTSLQKLENKDYVDIKINDLPQRLKKYAEENEMNGIFRIHKSDSNKYLYMKPQKDTTEYQVFNFNMEEFNKYANVVDFYVKNQDLIDKFQDMI